MDKEERRQAIECIIFIEMMHQSVITRLFCGDEVPKQAMRPQACLEALRNWAQALPEELHNAGYEALAVAFVGFDEVLRELILERIRVAQDNREAGVWEVPEMFRSAFRDEDDDEHS